MDGMAAARPHLADIGRLERARVLAGSLWMAALRGERLWRIRCSPGASWAEPIAHWVGSTGACGPSPPRAIPGPPTALPPTDERGTVRAGDDGDAVDYDRCDPRRIAVQAGARRGFPAGDAGIHPEVRAGN